MIPPVPVLDHVVVNVRDRIDEAMALYQRLGFALTPRGTHSLGSVNHLAMFGTDYLELIGAPPGVVRPDLLGWPVGLNGVVFGTEDTASVHASLVQSGVPCGTPQELSRPVALPGGSVDAVFHTLRLPEDTTPAGRLYFCQHFTRNLVWRDEWRHHPNGAVGVIAVVIAAAWPERLGELFRRMFGGGAVRAIPGGVRLVAGTASVDVVTPMELGHRFGDAAPAADGRGETMAALVLRVRDLARADTALQVDGVRREPGRLLVPASAAMGVVLEFRENG